MVSIKAEHPDYPRLLAALRVAKGFCLFLAECNIPILREHIVDALAHDCGKPIVRVDLQPDLLSSERFKTIDAIIAAAACEAPPNGILSVSGLEAGLHNDETQQTAHTLQEINFRRSALQRLGRPLIFWLPTYAMTLLARKAPDLHDWYSGIFIFEGRNDIDAYKIHKRNNNLDNLTVHQRYLRLETLTSLLETVRKEDDQQSIIPLLISLAITQAGLGLIQASLNTSLELQRILKLSGRTQDLIDACNGIALLYSSLGQREKALRYLYDEILAASFKLKADIAITNCLFRIATLLISSNDIEAAKYIVDEELNPLIAQAPITGFDIKTKELLAAIAEQEGDLDRALQINKHIAQQYKDKSDQEHYAETLVKIAKLYCKKNEHDPAINIIKKTVIPIYTCIKNRQALADAKSCLASILTTAQKFDEAYTLIKEARSDNEAIGNKIGIIDCIIRTSNIELEKGDIVKAAELFKQAYHMICQTEAFTLKSKIEFGYGRLLYLSGNKEEGLAILRRNANHYRQMGDNNKATEVEDAIHQLADH